MKVKRETFSLSGFGGAYEDQCQRSLWRGVQYLEEKNPSKEMWEGVFSYENVYGILHTEGEEIKRMEEEVFPKGEDITGAIHQCVMQHLHFIHTHSIEEWKDALGEARKDEGFIWEGEI